MNKKLTLSIPIFIAIIVSVIVTMIMMNQNPNPSPEIIQPTKNEEIIMDKIYISIKNQKFEINLEDNASTRALIEKLKTNDITIMAKDYGGFEKIGELGFPLPTNDTKITTTPGDLMLYQGDQITLFYGENTWDYTKLGHINLNKAELKAILGDGDVVFILSLK